MPKLKYEIHSIWMVHSHFTKLSLKCNGKKNVMLKKMTTFELVIQKLQRFYTTIRAMYFKSVLIGTIRRINCTGVPKQ